MIPVDEALRLIRTRAETRPLSPESIGVEASAGRALAAPVHSLRSLPPFTNSQMDGFAIVAQDAATATADAPVRLKVTQRVHAGEQPTASVGRGQAARIMTGAPIPPGANAVVKQEDVSTNDQGFIELDEPVEPGSWIRELGSDVHLGDLLVGSGELITASELALMASAGLTTLSVHRRPTVAVMSTGDEIVPFGSPMRDDQLVDSNSMAIAARLRQMGVEPRLLGVAPDDPARIRSMLESALSCDLIIASAGVSVGDRDYVRGCVRDLGFTIEVDSVAMRPGKPLMFAHRGPSLLFGLPGNPVSSRVTFEVFAVPCLRALRGIARAPVSLHAALDSEIAPLEELTLFVRVQLRSGDHGLCAVPMAKQGSHQLRGLAGADGLAVIPPGGARLQPGARVQVVPLFNFD